MKKLTDLTIQKLKPRADRFEISHGTSGLRLVVHPSGAKAWIVRYRVGGKSRKLTLGAYPAIGIVAAQKQAANAAEQVEHGKDPGADKIAARTAQKVALATTFDAVADEFLVRYNGRKLAGLRDSTRKYWKSLLKPAQAKWKNRPIAAITKADVRAFVEGMAANAPVLANRTLTLLKTFFAWARKRDYIDRSPAEDVDAPATEQSRDRVLTDDELRKVWKAASADDYIGSMIKLLILTGVRRDEAREAVWSEFDLAKAEWMIPGRRTKNGRDHLVPLSPLVLDTLRSIRRIEGCDYLFSTDGKVAIDGISRGLTRLRKAAGFADWGPHDLRRTLASGIARFTPPVVIEAVLNHVSGVRSGVAGIYNRHTYDPEKRAALERWAEHVDAVVNGRAPAKILPLKFG